MLPQAQPRPSLPLALDSTLIERVQRVAHEFGLSALLPSIHDVLRQANAMLGIEPQAGASAAAQADALLLACV